ncbi:hypothetical protein MLD38_003976 [Melastoma candidum]|uniref:Uncharacterized protein n=1 Tax=Melastoma candidum TaxID=119954 RepID=A0ACB9S4Z3_9MYRT|nr:hypothetical protein MLD38_003976 [Melastoma candidum]
MAEIRVPGASRSECQELPIVHCDRLNAVNRKEYTFPAVELLMTSVMWICRLKNNNLVVLINPRPASNLLSRSFPPIQRLLLSCSLHWAASP